MKFRLHQKAIEKSFNFHFMNCGAVCVSAPRKCGKLKVISAMKKFYLLFDKAQTSMQNMIRALHGTPHTTRRTRKSSLFIGINVEWPRSVGCVSSLAPAFIAVNPFVPDRGAQ